MKQKLFLLVALFCLVPSMLLAQEVAKDTIAFTATRVVPEPDPNANDYVFSFWGTDKSGQEWKVQVDYTSTTMYGTYTDADFALDSDGKYYNWIRKTDDDRYMRYFKHIDLTVTDNSGDTHVEMNAMILDGSDWRRVLVTADIIAPKPADTIAVDLGIVGVAPQTFYESLILEAANEEYSLATGITRMTQLKAGTYYRTELLRPDFVRLATNDTIKASTAQLEVTDSVKQGLFNLRLDLYNETENRVYRLLMHTSSYDEVTDTVFIECPNAQIQYYEYGFYRIAGEGTTDYTAALSLKPGVLSSNTTEIPSDSIVLDFSLVARTSTGEKTRIQYATATISPDPEDIFKRYVYADLYGTDKVLYRITFVLGSSTLPSAADTVYIDCGNHVGRVDYSQDLGWLGLVLGNDEADIHISVYNQYEMTGFFTSDYFNYGEVNGMKASYVTSYIKDVTGKDSITRFSDVAENMAELRMEMVNDTVHITLDAITVSNIRYHFTANLLPKRCLTGDSVAYNLDLTNGVDMVAYRKKANGHKQFQLQIRRADAWDEEGYPIGDSEMWNFAFNQDSIDGVSGKYQYVGGTLSTELSHYIYEGGTEIYIGPVAGSLTLEAGREVVIDLDGTSYRSHLYTISSRFQGANNMIYSLQGQTVLVCADYDTDRLLEFTERLNSALEKVLIEQGYRVRKVYRDGIILIETDNGTFTTTGKQVK